MKINLLIGFLIFMSINVYSDYIERILKYCLNNEISNATIGVDFVLQNDGNGLYIKQWNLEIPQPTDEQLPGEEESINAKNIVWQNNKSPLLKIVENLYVDFLTNTWTTILRDKSIIESTNVITVENTVETQNILYLMYLRSIDFDTYDKMAGEFDRFKNTIEENGGIMSKVKSH
jgi:hypothetical protein